MYNPEFESMPRDEIEQLQTERLQTTLNRVYRSVAFYRHTFDAIKFDVDSVRSVREIRRLPFTTREDLKKSYPYDMFAVPLKDIVRVHSSSGTTGQSVVVGYTKNDIAHWAQVTARALAAAGINEHDFVQIAFDYSLFTGGFGFHYGAERIGASVIPSSAHGNIAKQIRVMKDYKTSALLCTPSYAMEIAYKMKEMGIHPETLKLRCGLFGAEPWGAALRARLEEMLHIDAFDVYGLSEIMGPGVSSECVHKNGLHVNEDHFIVEVIDPATCEPLPAGAQGELVFTTITKEGFPLIRYRTGDRASLMEGTCPCGRTLVRMSRVAGRTDDLIIYKGLKVYPVQIEEALLKAENVKPRYMVYLDQEDGIDAMEIRIEVSDALFNDELKNLLAVKNKVARILEEDLELVAKITLVEPGSLKGDDGGKSRVVDRRA
ncbi:MAG: phenylacetate--CoA ligase family protein [Spirochaetes bacterium]|nr:MAG: phenylacetate--CoA ligase family protein [Spirochaetota bacterium]